MGKEALYIVGYNAFCQRIRQLASIGLFCGLLKGVEAVLDNLLLKIPRDKDNPGVVIVTWPFG